MATLELRTYRTAIGSLRAVQLTADNLAAVAELANGRVTRGNVTIPTPYGSVNGVTGDWLIDTPGYGATIYSQPHFDAMTHARS